MRLLLIAMLFVSARVSSSEGDTLNRMDANGKKHGYWLVYLDSAINPTDSASSYFYAYELYENGVPLFSFRDFRKNIKIKESCRIQSLPEKGRPELLDMTVRWYQVRDGVISREEKYSKGHPVWIKGYSRKTGQLFSPDTTDYVVELFDFTKKYWNEAGSHYLEFYSSDGSATAYWFRKKKGKWGYYRVNEPARQSPER
jgi:hypothetical protein